MNPPSQPFILGLDLGANSLGWALLRASALPEGDQIRYQPTGIERMGVRIFPEGVEGGEKGIAQGKDQSRGVKRRVARLARRQIDRRARRQRILWRALVQAGLLPPGDDSAESRHLILWALDKEIRSRLKSQGVTTGLDQLPYLLRARALDCPLEPFELGRALYHLAQRRGYLPNRKVAPTEDEREAGPDAGESAPAATVEDRKPDARRPKKEPKLGKVQSGIAEIEQRMQAEGARTLGEYFAGCDPHDWRIRCRFTARRMYQDEFDAIWSAQAPHHPTILTDQLRRGLHRAIFYQRPLKKPSNLGLCELESAGKRRRYRAPWCLLEAQRFRLLQKVNDLQIEQADRSYRPLSPEQRRDLVAALEELGDLSFADIKKRLALPRGAKFNLERGGEKRLPGNRTAAGLRAVFGPDWDSFDEQKKAAIVEDCFSIQNDKALARRGRRHWGLSPDKARELARMRLEPDYCRFSRQALRRLLPHLEKGVNLEVAIRAEYPEGRGAGEAVTRLDGVRKALRELRNPMVERALTELRKVVNAIVREYGVPAEIHLELARDLKRSRKDRELLSQRMREREKERKSAEEEIVKKVVGLPRPSRNDIEKYLLWKECGGICPYTGRSISCAALFGDSPEFQVEHILPRWRSLDDSFANKTLCHVSANAEKGNRTPFEAFGASGGRWEQILQRVERFEGHADREKLRRFKLHGADLEAQLEQFESRRLNDTRYASRLAARYLSAFYGGTKDGVDASGRRRLYVSNGQATAFLRDVFDLNSILGDGGQKDRTDHRSHAVDALTVALMSPATVKSLSDALAGNPTRGRKLRLPAVWDGLLDDARAAVAEIVVSHRPDRRVSGPLHNETIYGPPVPGQDGERAGPRVRKPLAAMSKDEVARIVDPEVRRIVLEKLRAVDPQNLDPSKVFRNEENLPLLPSRKGPAVIIRSARVVQKCAPVTVGSGTRERLVPLASNHHIEVIERSTGKDGVIWDGRVVTMLEAHRRVAAGRQVGRPSQHVVSTSCASGERFLFALHLGDPLNVLDANLGNHILVVDGISQSISGAFDIELRSHADARPRAARGTDRIRRNVDGLRKAGAAPVDVDPLGRVNPRNA